MMKKINLKLFSKKKNFKKKDLWLDLTLYWRISLYLLFVVLVSALVFGFLLFRRVNKEIVLSEEEVVGEIKMIKEDRIHEVLQYFEERDEQSDSIIYSPARIADPSI